ncbi:hypothetical protein [Parapedobacter soli]|uniref:hypothetical protein n=1 Tax=Parapedobacter soli TaxID=416955 RepID=UPI0021C81BCB|nr:hypothetical protein [Parapedobacter soli]
MIRFVLATVVWLGALIVSSHTQAVESPIVIANDDISYAIGRNGENIHFITHSDGVDYLEKDSVSHCAYAIHNGNRIAAQTVEWKKGRLRIGFGTAGVTATIRVTQKNRYLVWELEHVEGDIESITFLNVPLRVKGMPDEPTGLCALSLTPYTHVRQLPALQTYLWATAYQRFGLAGAQVAVLGLPPSEMLPNIRSIMEGEAAMPISKGGGAWALGNKEGYGSYLMNFGSLTEETVDEWIEMCRNLGFNQIDNHGGGFFNFGELKIDESRFPGGWSSFARINKRLNEAGISSIFHTYAYFIDKNSKYVTPEAHPDLGYFREFTLAQPIGPQDSIIVVNESTADVSTIIGFFVRNSVSLRIGGEIIEFTGVTDSPPYMFTGCKRGVHGTQATAYDKGEVAYHLKEVYGRFTADPESELFKEMGKRTAEIVNEAGFNGIYLDAADGGNVLGGSENFWYYPSAFIFEIAKHLDKPVGMEMASMSHFWWHYRSRWQAWDTPFRGYKRFIDIHLAAIKSPNEFLGQQIKHNDFEHGVWQGDTALINKYAPLDNGALMLPLTLGWWGHQIGESPQSETTFTDVAEYLAGKMLGNDAGTAILSGFDPGTRAQIPLFGRLDSIIRQYELLRHQNYFPDSVKAMLRQPGKEFQLIQEQDGGWNFRPAKYDLHKVARFNESDQRLTVTNDFAAQPVKLRLEALLGAEGFDNPENTVLVAGAQDGFVLADQAEGVSGELIASNQRAPDGSETFRFTANSEGKVVQRGAWINMEKVFEPALNIQDQQGLGVWIKGDGNGQILNIRLESPIHISHGARGDHFVKIDFKGWRYFDLVEIESTEFSNYQWPNSDFYVYDSYRHSVDFKNINKIQLWYNNLPAGKPAECHVSVVKALPLRPAVLQNPSITIGNKKLTFQVNMESGMYLEFFSESDCQLYSNKGELLGQVTVVGEVPQLEQGVNEVKVRCEQRAGAQPRVQATFISYGEPIMNKDNQRTENEIWR